MLRQHVFIAGIDFSIAHPDGTALLAPGPNYADFLRPPAVVPEDDVFNLTIATDPMPSVSGLESVFNGGGSWSLLRGPEGYYYISINTVAEGGRPLCLARVDGGFTAATVYYDGRLIDAVDGLPVLPNPMRYPLDKILVMYVLSMRQGLLAHAACVVYKGRGYVFPGLSGAGKTTLSRLFSGCPDALVLTDERVAIRRSGDGFAAYGTPWHGELGAAINGSVKLDDIFFISHGGENAICEIGAGEALERLIPVSTIPWYDAAVFPRMLELCETLVGTVPVYEFSFTPTAEAVEAVEGRVHA